jgi:hypothetical protein
MADGSSHQLNTRCYAKPHSESMRAGINFLLSFELH